MVQLLQFVDVDDLLPDETTIPRKCKKEADEKRETLSLALKDFKGRSGISLTMDLWTDNHVKRTFLGVMVHFEQNFQMVNRILGLKSMESATTANVLDKLQSLLNTFGIDSLENIKFVTDQTETNKFALQVHSIPSSRVAAEISFSSSSEYKNRKTK